MLVKIRHHFADPLADNAVQAALFLERRIRLQVTKIDRSLLRVEDHLDDAITLVHRIEQVAVACL